MKTKALQKLAPREPYVAAVACHSDFIQLYHASEADLHRELCAGLSAPSAYVQPKYFYDELGSKLFAAICELPEYYPTRTEAEILKTCLGEIAEAVGLGTTLIDLGAGDCAKASRLFAALQPAQYVPVDISVEFLRDAVSQLQQRYPHIQMTGVGLDFSTEIKLPAAVKKNMRLFFYPGSSIGNFSPAQALEFLLRLRSACASDGGVLIGVDLVKDHQVLNAAYDDALGVTASFNLNLLSHLNRLLEANFDIRAWKHFSFYNATESRIEMYLEARHSQTVQWRGGTRVFKQGERIHTENSYKYTPDNFIQLLQQAGMVVNRTWTDKQGWFMVCHARMQ
jgi:dimethylhistidine N-methyltransferase